MTETSSASVILNVNDSVANRYFVTRVLRAAGWTVLEAETGGAGIAMAREHLPSLIVLDVKLPDMSGHEVCRVLRADPATAHVRVIQTSATFVTSEGKARGLEAGADQYLTQPFESVELVAMVRGLLRLNEKEAEAREKAEALTEAHRRKDEFLAMLAHELRNPLSAIMTANTLLEGLELPPTGLRLSATIGRQTRHLARLVDDLLDVARITSRKIQLRRAPLDLGTLVERFAAGDAAGVTKNHRLSVAISDEPIWVDGDATRLEQVMSNLVSNAAKYTARGGAIAIELASEGTGEQRRAVITVRDDGVGISKENLGAVFELFFQADATLARSQSGLGIGLTMVKQLVEMHDGTVSVSSRGVGEGAEFRVELPAVASRSRPVTSPPIVASDRRLAVLVIDDNVDSCELVGLSFEKQGHAVTLASDGKEGLKLALEGSFDLAIVDIGLPTLDGYEIARAVRAERKDDGPLLIALTGYGRLEDKQRAREAGFDVHLVKPVSVHDIHRLIGRLLSERAPGQKRSA